MQLERQVIDISTSTILRVIVILGILAFLYIIKDILVILFLALIIVSAMHPAIGWLQRRRVPRLVGVILMYLIAIFMLALVVYIVVPPLATEIKELSKTFPESLANFSIVNYEQQYGFVEDYPRITGNVKSFLSNLSEQLETFSSSLFNATANLFGGLVSGILVLVISFYLAIQEEGIKNFFRSILPSEHQAYVFHLWSRTELKMGKWLQGQLMLGLIVGLITFIGLSSLGVKYSLVLAIIAALFELIPYAGPVLAAIPAILIGASSSLMLGGWVLVMYVVVQQIENHILVPKVMQRAVSLNPIIIIIAILIGAKLGGIVGIIIAVPLAAILVEIFYDFTEHEHWNFRIPR